MNQGQGFLAGTGFEHHPQSGQPVHAQPPVPGSGMALVNLAAPQNPTPVCTGVAVPCRITATNRYGEPREVIVYFHLPAQTPEQLKAAIENLIAMGFNIPAQRPFERSRGFGNRQYSDAGHNCYDGPRQFRPKYEHGY
jgi:hypothetical protein